MGGSSTLTLSAGIARAASIAARRATSRSERATLTAGSSAASVIISRARSSRPLDMTDEKEPSEDQATTCTCLLFGAFSCSAAIHRTDDSGTPIATAREGVSSRRHHRCHSSLQPRRSSPASSRRTLTTHVESAPSAVARRARASRKGTAPSWSKRAVEPGRSA